MFKYLFGHIFHNNILGNIYMRTFTSSKRSTTLLAPVQAQNNEYLEQIFRLRDEFNCLRASTIHERSRGRK